MTWGVRSPIEKNRGLPPKVQPRSMYVPSNWLPKISIMSHVSVVVSYEVNEHKWRVVWFRIQGIIPWGKGAGKQGHEH